MQKPVDSLNLKLTSSETRISQEESIKSGSSASYENYANALLLPLGISPQDLLFPMKSSDSIESIFFDKHENFSSTDYLIENVMDTLPVEDERGW